MSTSTFTLKTGKSANRNPDNPQLRSVGRAFSLPTGFPAGRAAKGGRTRHALICHMPQTYFVSAVHTVVQLKRLPLPGKND